MSPFAYLSVLLLLAAVLGSLNYLYLGMPHTIALMAGSLLLSVVILLVDRSISSIELRQSWENLVAVSNLPHVFLDGVLAFMLFAGSLHVDVDVLRTQKWTVLALATLGVVMATALYGLGIWVVFARAMPLPWCVVLGALLAPTDPIAVGGLLRQAGLPADLLAVVSGESLFNDGVAVVVFSTALNWANGQSTDVTALGLDMLLQAGGGLALGLVTGYVAYRAVRLIDDPGLELLITLALATVTYSVAEGLGVSAPLAVVVAGLLTGHRSTRFGMTDLSREQVVLFWDLVDELLNAVLFVLLGFALLSVDIDFGVLRAVAGGIALALLTRLISVAVPTTLVHLRRLPKLSSVVVLTWGGLRGGISVALALTLQPSPFRGAMLTVCYAVVVFTILVQGLSMPALVRRLYRRPITPAPQSPQ